MTHFDFQLESDEAIFFFNKISENSRAKEEFKRITSIYMQDSIAYSMRQRNILPSLNSLFPNLQKIELNLSLEHAVSILNYIWEHKLDITVDITREYAGMCGMLNINQFRPIECPTKRDSQIECDSQYFGWKYKSGTWYEIFQFDSALISFGPINEILSVKSDFGVIYQKVLYSILLIISLY